MKLNKTFVIPIAGLLVVLAAGAVLATSGSPGGGSPAAVVPAAESASPAPSASTRPLKAAVDSTLTGVLDELVTKGTITAAQKTAILDALQAKRDALQAERKALQEARKLAAQQLKDFLSDGQITQAELDKLPADSPIRQLTKLMDDGKITTDELRSLGRGLFNGFGGKGHFWGANGFGHGNKDAAPSASPST